MPICSYYNETTHTCSLRDNAPIPASWMYCVNQPEKCPWYKKGEFTQKPVSIQDFNSTKRLDLDVIDNILTAISELATQATLNAIKNVTDKLQFDESNNLKCALGT